MAEFNPNKDTLAACLARIEAHRKARNIQNDKIITSRSVGDVWSDKDLHVSNVPGGFNKVILPFASGGPATFYISSAGPGVKVPRHSHDEGAGVRFIVSGSIIYEGNILSQGDWMYMPAGAPYEFTVGPMGVTMFYCYECCCA